MKIWLIGIIGAIASCGNQPAPNHLQESDSVSGLVSPVIARYHDCKAFAYHIRGYCQHSDCFAVFDGRIALCTSRDCQAMVLGSAKLCATNDCRAIARRDERAAQCESPNCEAILNKDPAYCRDFSADDARMPIREKF